MDREFKSKVGWWYHLIILLVIVGSIKAFLSTNMWMMVIMLIVALLVLHVFFNTFYRVTTDGFLIVHCSIFPEKKIAIADIDALEQTAMPVSSYALSLDRLIVWKKGQPWMLISPKNQHEFVKLLKTINPDIKLK